MRKFVTALIATLAFVAAGSVVAEENIPGKDRMEAAAGEMALSSIRYMSFGGDIDRAVGNATIALDIARQIGDAELVRHLEKLLYVARTVNIIRTASAMEITGKPTPGLKILGCKMAKEAPPELRETVRKQTGNYCAII